MKKLTLLTPATKQAAAAQTDTPSACPETYAVDAERRNRTIAEAAYYLAEARGFAQGREIEDWLAAEAEFER